MTHSPYRIHFSGVGYRYTDAQKAVVLKAMDAVTTLTQGEYQKQFEQDFCHFVEMPFSFATSSCATAIELAALLIDAKPGDEIICPAHTYCASVYPFARHGVTIKWADIDLNTLVVTAETIAPLITEKTKAIMVVHLYGLPAPMQEIMALAKKHGIYVIEDCAQAIGATIQGKRVGGFGDISVFSFQSHKNISTLGEGGMLCVKDPAWARILPGLRHNGHCPYPAPRDRYWVPAMVNIDFDVENVWPHNFCLGEAQCALGIALLKEVDAIRQHRRARFYRMAEALREFDEIIFQNIPEHYESAHHLMPFRYDDRMTGKTNHDVIEHLVTQHKVQAIVQYYPLYRYPLFSKSGHGDANVPNTDCFFDNMVSLPFHHWLSDIDFEYLIKAVRETALYLRESSRMSDAIKM